MTSNSAAEKDNTYRIVQGYVFSSGKIVTSMLPPLQQYSTKCYTSETAQTVTLDVSGVLGVTP